jgi:hypothetical protein
MPDATLFALNESIPDDVKWRPTAIKALKKQQPETIEEAKALVISIQRVHLEKLFGAPLPVKDDLSLDHLDEVEEQDRARVLAKLQAAGPQPLDADEVRDIILDLRHDPNDDEVDPDGDDKTGDDDSEAGDDEGDDDGETGDDEGDDDGETGDDEGNAKQGEPLDERLIEALRVVIHYARRPMPTSTGGIEGVELVEAARFLDKLHEIATGGNKIKRIADEAEAISRRWKESA